MFSFTRYSANTIWNKGSSLHDDKRQDVWLNIHFFISAYKRQQDIKWILFSVPPPSQHKKLYFPLEWHKTCRSRRLNVMFLNITVHRGTELYFTRICTAALLYKTTLACSIYQVSICLYNTWNILVSMSPNDKLTRHKNVKCSNKITISSH